MLPDIVQKDLRYTFGVLENIIKNRPPCTHNHQHASDHDRHHPHRVSVRVRPLTLSIYVTLIF